MLWRKYWNKDLKKIYNIKIKIIHFFTNIKNTIKIKMEGLAFYLL
jgi:hypothetical protein